MSPVKAAEAEEEFVQISSCASCFPLIGSQQLTDMHAKPINSLVQAFGTMREDEGATSFLHGMVL